MMNETEVMNKVIAMLKGSPELVGMLSTFKAGGKKQPMIVQGLILPSDWGVQSTACMLYTVYQMAQLNYTRFNLSITCFAPTYQKSRLLAMAVQNVLNRNCADGFFTVTTILQTLPPVDGETDNYKTPVEILVRAS